MVKVARFSRPIRIYVPATSHYVDVQELRYPDHALGFQGDVDMVWDFDGRLLCISVVTLQAHSKFYVPAEHVTQFDEVTSRAPSGDSDGAARKAQAG